MRTLQKSKYLVCVWVLLGAGVSLAATITVPGDFATIQAAIDDPGTVDGDEIVVASGTYVIAAPIDFKGKAVTLRSASGDPNDTILDGQGSVYHVVQCISGEGAASVLTGFTITGGNANGSYPDDQGGGMYNYNSSPTVTNCIFSGNLANYYGGGMYNERSSPTVTDCVFTGNSGEYCDGGGMYNYGSSPTLRNCIFSINSAFLGGGMCNSESSSPLVENCTFSDNSADEGGGILNDMNCSPTVANCTFIANSAIDGGGMWSTRQCSPIVSHCSFIDNSATDIGGGMGGIFAYSSQVAQCRFIGNSAGNTGGAMYIGKYAVNTPHVTNCTFSGNSAVNGGGGIYYSESFESTLTNCTFSRNTASGGGGIFVGRGSLNVSNCIFREDSPGAILSAADTYVLTVTYSNIEGGFAGTGNIDADPLFADAYGADNIAGTADDDLRLLAGSPCIDAGSTLMIPSAWDVSGAPRLIDDPDIVDTGIVLFGLTIDMGAYEYQLTPDPCDSADPADFDCSGTVDLQDLAHFATQWLQ